MKFVVLILLAVTSPALAQAPTQTPSQTALKLNSVIANWAEMLEAQAKQITDLQKQLDEAKTKCEAPDAQHKP